MNAQDRRDEQVELGEEVRVRRRGGNALVAVRLSTDLLRRVQDFARATGLTVSDVLRLGAEYVTSQGLTTATSYTVRTVATMRYATAPEEFTEPAAPSLLAGSSA